MNTEDFRINHAELIVAEEFGDLVSVQLKKKDLIKFGLNANVGTATTGYTLWTTGVDLANEVYLADSVNIIDSVSSSSVSDTQQIRIEGHTDIDGKKTFVIQTVTLNGRNRVALPTPLNRSSRVYNIGNINFAGSIYVYQNTALTTGKPTDVTNIHVSTPLGSNQSRKASTSVSNSDYWIVTGFSADILSKTASSAEVVLEVRRRGSVFRPVATISCSTNHQGFFGGGAQPYLIIPKNSDVRLVAIASGANTVVSGTISGYLAAITTN